MPEKVLISKSDLDRLADIVSQRCDVSLPLTVGQMQTALTSCRQYWSNNPPEIATISEAFDYINIPITGGDD